MGENQTIYKTVDNQLYQELYSSLLSILIDLSFLFPKAKCLIAMSLIEDPPMTEKCLSEWQ